MCWKKLKSCLVFILKSSQKSKTSFLLFWEEVMVEAKIILFIQWVLLQAMADLTFHLGFLCTGSHEQGLVLVNSSFTRVIFICQAKLHELGEIDSLCLWPFNQKRIPAEIRQ
jgi:hypothetical protein